ncbi:CgeB family protein [Mesorhizobium sp. 1B3]|uniref:CgeB family protein n=1 Tax=Mesorhizobium sp. 1B3 TaxID=3243599 RepID=UPI003D9944F7
MTGKPLRIVFIGLSLSSSWGNGHATTFRALMRALQRRGHELVFLERDVSWYARNRDLTDPEFCELRYYDTVADLLGRYGATIRSADAVIIGSYVPEGVAVIDQVAGLATGRLCFYDIDTPVTLAKLSAGEHDYIANRQVQLFDTYFSFTGGPTLRRLEREYGARRALALYCSVDSDRYRNTGEPHRWDLGYLGTYSPDRQEILERLLIEPARRMPGRRFVVAGPLYPPEIDWPGNVERIEHLPPQDHPSFYSRQRFTLNVTRADMIAAGWSPSVRLFEAAACGTPVISDVWNGLGDFFPLGEAILTASSSAAVVRILQTTSSAARAKLAARALTKVLAEHTAAVRARELEASLAPQCASALVSANVGEHAF